MSDAFSEEDPVDQGRREGHNQIPQLVKDGGADIDRFFDALGETRRRLILLLLDHHDSADLDELTEAIAKYEGVETSDEQVERIRTDLHHCQLPKLRDHGLISYDTRTNTASLVPLPETVEKMLQLTRELEGICSQ